MAEVIRPPSHSLHGSLKEGDPADRIESHAFYMDPSVHHFPLRIAQVIHGSPRIAQGDPADRLQSIAFYNGSPRMTTLINIILIKGKQAVHIVPAKR